ncbi:MAG: hypothetical protein DI556_21605 [Rhodovulum sulfidophilum]|uniref:Uncharacterized protein n=1 Tax=Rhodovulum sulfidophilum TaxID=35806 RepID=A0A2W5MYT2_RHOSU|nr:MAG: hypothetical protein DI556_21605 [Rhodovulum sulfidophilum]
MSAPVKPPPAPFDARQLADTLDTMGLLVASLSDRIDAQSRMLEQVLKTATEARAAAFAAEKATDWKRNGDFIDEGIARQSRYVDELVKAMDGQIDVMNLVFEEVIPFLRIVGPRELKRRARLLRWWIPLMLAGAFVLGVGMTLMLAWIG